MYKLKNLSLPQDGLSANNQLDPHGYSTWPIKRIAETKSCVHVIITYQLQTD